MQIMHSSECINAMWHSWVYPMLQNARGASRKLFEYIIVSQSKFPEWLEYKNYAAL